MVSVLCWDNLSTKGIFHARPDLLLAWNEHHVRDAIEIHGFHKKQIKVVGSAFFDKWWGKLPEIPSRETFCRRIGLDPSRPILLYLGSSPSIAADERWLLTSLTKALKAEPDKRIQEFQILVRPHPGHAIESGGCEGEGCTVWPKSGSLPSSSVEFSDFLSTLTYSELTVGLNTSAMIDAVIRGLPSIAFLSPEYAKTQIESQHFQELLNGNAVYRASSIDELIKKVRELAFEKKDPLKEARERFVIEHVRPHGLDTEAGALSSIVLEDFLSRWQRRGLKTIRPKEQAPNFSNLVSKAPRAALRPQRVLMATSLGSYHHGVVMDSAFYTLTASVDV